MADLEAGGMEMEVMAAEAMVVNSYYWYRYACPVTPEYTKSIKMLLLK